jgi:hypothetical protein
MFKPVIARPLIRMAGAACVASAVAFAITASASPGATHSGVQDATPAAFADSTHLRVPVRGNLCSAHGWPNFEPSCQFDLREPGGEARVIRVIALQ